MHRMPAARDPGIAVRRAKQAVAMTAPRHAIVDQQLVNDAFGRVMAIGDDFADIGAAAARLHPFAGPAAPRIMTDRARARLDRSEEHTSELQSLMRISYAVFCLKKKTPINDT